MGKPPTVWRLEGFEQRLDSWIDQESPEGDLALVVAAWIMSRYEDPYLGVRRETQFPNLWFGAIPRTYTKGTVVACSYWIEESTKTVRCNSIATLSVPL